MADSKHEFTNVTTLRGEAIGEPGKRAFRIVVDSGSSSAVMWLEKEQLFQIALAIQQLVATLRGEQSASGTLPVEREASGLTRLDFQVSKLVLGHDGGRELFIIDAFDPEDAEGQSSTCRVWATVEQAKKFAEDSIQVCAAGRPQCPLCGGPMDSDGHLCPRVNGRVKGTNL